MSEVADMIRDIVREAVEGCECAAPEQTLAFFASTPNPINTLVDTKYYDDLFQALERDLGFLRAARFSGRPLSEVDRKRCASLIAWLISNLRTWPSAEGKGAETFAAMMALMAGFGGSSDLWASLPDDISENIALINAMTKVIAATGVKFRTSGLGDAPLWETEAVDAFQRADRSEDWIKIVELWQPLKHAGRPDILQTQAVRFLARFAFDRFAEVINKIDQTPTIMLFLDALTISQRLRLALLCNNPRCKLCCVYRVVSHGEVRGRLVNEDIQSLQQVLSTIAKDVDLWLVWMKIFNKYPVRFPSLQEALGQTLAICSTDNLKAYVHSISLYAWPATPTGQNEGRQCVGRCLIAFSKVATEAQRNALWTIVHHRWETWNFGEGRNDRHLMEMSRSDIDYGVAAYAAKCMTEADRNAVIDTIRRKMATLENQWHPSLSDCITAWNRLLSQMQPYAHASMSRDEHVSLLTETQINWPFYLELNRHARAMFDVRR